MTNSTVSNTAISLQCLEASKVYRLVQVGGTAVNLVLSCLLLLSLSLANKAVLSIRKCDVLAGENNLYFLQKRMRLRISSCRCDLGSR